MAGQTFSLDQLSPLHHTIYQKRTRKCTSWWIIEDFFVHHIWMGMFTRQHCHAFSRKVKCSGAFSIILLAGFIVMLRMGISQFKDDAELDEGSFHMDSVLYHAIGGLFYAVLVVYPIVYIMK